MQYLKKLCALVIGGTLLTLTSCEDTNEANPQTQSSLLTGSSQKTWKVTTVKKDGVARPQSNCILDDQHIFAVNKTYELNEGESKCNATDPQKLVGSWSMSNSIITIREKGKADVYLEVKPLTATKMIVDRNISGAKFEVSYQVQ